MVTEAKSPEPEHPARSFGLALAAGLLAGLAAWAVGEAFVGRFGPPEHLLGKVGATDEVVRLTAAATAKRATVAYAALGAALGLAMGLAGGLARRLLSAGLTAAALGTASGAAAGLVASLALVPLFESLRVPIADNLLIPVLLHGGIWSASGAAGGLAFGLGRGGQGAALRAALGGLLGALLGTVVYELVGALAFPAAGTSGALSTARATRLLACLAVTLPAASGSVQAIRGPRARPEMARSAG